MHGTLLTGVAIVALAIAALSAAWIVADLAMGRRPRMAIMAVVWPVTALYLGPVAVWAWRRWGAPAPAGRGSRDAPAGAADSAPSGLGIALATAHCGAGCTLGDLLGAVVVFTLGLSLAGATIWAEVVVDGAIALALGVGFQYFTIAPMRGLGLVDGLRAAIRADVVSLAAFEVGMLGWMVVVQLGLSAGDPLRPTEPGYWLMMQAGMILGFVTALPANRWLVRRGIKEPM